MPDRDGIEVIRELRHSYPDLKILAISGGGLCGSGQDYLLSSQVICNIEHTLTKPFKKD